MNKINEKIITLSFAVFGFLLGLSVHLILKSFSAAFAFIARVNENDLFKHGVPVVLGLGIFIYLQFNKKTMDWAREVYQEISKVVFPSKSDTSALTIVVIVFVLISSVIITLFDFVSSFIVKGIIN
ncbi:MAG: preprotein translocase subunit SecE [Bdellovibrionaceae bacterium]|nr:preprotein translocase subunit SecE [Pseudobdellovibrionaceae bacterium]NUM60025.1 preprotein translocase subunit SecE [Pseudobdellovibrionaceae bacterium]